MQIAVAIILNGLAFLLAAALMEVVARLMHKYVMHGTGWCLHYDHHNHSGKVFQKNDLYALFFAGLSFVLIFFGLRAGALPIASAGFGVALYGVGYVLFHDIMYHRRIKWLQLRARHPYLKRIINAHRVHHATVTQGGAVSYSFLWAPKKYGPEFQKDVDKQIADIHAMQLALKRARQEEKTAKHA